SVVIGEKELTSKHITHRVVPDLTIAPRNGTLTAASGCEPSKVLAVAMTFAVLGELNRASDRLTTWPPLPGADNEKPTSVMTSTWPGGTVNPEVSVPSGFATMSTTNALATPGQLLPFDSASMTRLALPGASVPPCAETATVNPTPKSPTARIDLMSMLLSWKAFRCLSPGQPS